MLALYEFAPQHYIQLVLEAHVCNPSTQEEGKTEEQKVQGHPRLERENLRPVLRYMRHCLQKGVGKI